LTITGETGAAVTLTTNESLADAVPVAAISASPNAIATDALVFFVFIGLTDKHSLFMICKLSSFQWM
jgi:hypothetical protein